MTRRPTRVLSPHGKGRIIFLLSILSASLFGYLIGSSSLPSFSSSAPSSSFSSSYTKLTSGRVLQSYVGQDTHENIADEVSNDVQEEGGEEEGEWELQDFSAIVIIVLALIFLTILFEVAKEHLEESVSEDFEVILEKFFGELTVLGFLAMVTFLISRTGTIQRISEHVFGKEEELVEYIEYVVFTMRFDKGMLILLFLKHLFPDVS